MRYRVKRFALFFYGSENKAQINLNVGQIWEHKDNLSELYPYHYLIRQNVRIEITDDDFKRYFEPQAESGEQNADSD